MTDVPPAATDPRDPWTDDPLTSRFRIWQRKRGHRYSLDDVLTAYEALQVCPSPGRYLDLGCGIGSVWLMVCDRGAPQQVDAIEAQDISAQMVRENIRRNEAAVNFVHGDLRDASAQEGLRAPFDLITGTPPYAPPGTATPSPDSQRAHARVELRGGIEAYLEAAAALLAPRGDLVVCSSADAARVLRAAKKTSFVPRRQVAAIPRAGRDPLFYVWHMSRAEDVPEDSPLEQVEFVARDAQGARTEAYVALRAFFGLPLQSQSASTTQAPATSTPTSPTQESPTENGAHG